MESDVTTTRMNEITCCAHKKSCCSRRLQLGLTIVFFLGTVGLLVVLLWRELVYHRPADSDSETLEEKVLKKFPGYFRTQKEQESLAANLDSTQRILVNESIFDNLRKKRFGSSPIKGTYTGCCFSSNSFVSPNITQNTMNQTRIIVQFAKAKQVFQVIQCSQYTSCTGCRCQQELLVHSAVVLVRGKTLAMDIKDFEIDFFFFNGCCTCNNV